MASETVFPDAQSKLRAYLSVAETVTLLVKEIAADGSRMRLADAEDLHPRKRVILGLAIKAYNAFECLSKDAAVPRSESFHHLKTMAETHIYFQWVGINTEEPRANLILAEECRTKIALYREVPELDPEGILRDGLEKNCQSFINGLEKEWKHFRKSKLLDLAKETSQDMVGWYNRVYRVACEPAHISDLSEYMPPLRGAITLNPPNGPAIFRSLIALDFGLQIIFDLLKNIFKIFELPLPETVATPEREFYEIHRRPVPVR
jgi:hypothetical protein